MMYTNALFALKFSHLGHLFRTHGAGTLFRVNRKKSHVRLSFSSAINMWISKKKNISAAELTCFVLGTVVSLSFYCIHLWELKNQKEEGNVGSWTDHTPSWALGWWLKVQRSTQWSIQHFYLHPVSDGIKSSGRKKPTFNDKLLGILRHVKQILRN